MNIVRTEAPLGARIVDATLTAMGWLGFLYLFARGSHAMAIGADPTAQVHLGGTVLPPYQTLLFYLVIAATNALLLALWAVHKRAALPRYNNVPALRLDNDTLARHFALSPNQLNEVQDSRVTIIYHADDGDIVHLETDQLHSQPEPETGPASLQRA